MVWSVSVKMRGSAPNAWFDDYVLPPIQRGDPSRPAGFEGREDDLLSWAFPTADLPLDANSISLAQAAITAFQTIVPGGTALLIAHQGETIFHVRPLETFNG